MRRWLIVLGVVVLLAAAAVLWSRSADKPAAIASFEECAAAGYPIMESWPPRCAVPNGPSFTLGIGNELEKSDLILIENPRPTQQVSSPLEIRGRARGTWFFEASFPVKLLDDSGATLARGIATAQGEWMTTDFVPFTATLTYGVPSVGPGTLVLQKDNPSGLPENDDQLIVPVELVAPAGTPLLRSCPDEKIVSRMPPGSETSYYIQRGQRHEIAEYDGPWVLANCTVSEQVVY